MMSVMKAYRMPEENMTAIGLTLDNRMRTKAPRNSIPASTSMDEAGKTAFVRIDNPEDVIRATTTGLRKAMTVFMKETVL